MIAIFSMTDRFGRIVGWACPILSRHGRRLPRSTDALLPANGLESLPVS